MVLFKLERGFSSLSKPCSWFSCKKKKKEMTRAKDSEIDIDNIASQVTDHGSEFEKRLKKNYGTVYGFLLSTDTKHALYLEKLAEHRARDQDTDTVTIPAPFVGPAYYDTIRLKVSDPLPPCLFPPPTPFPQGITAKEYDTMKLTALFAARYKESFMQELEKRNDPQFDFAFFEKSTTGDKYLVFDWLRGSFVDAILFYRKLKMPSMEPVVEALIKLVQGEGPFVSGIDYIAGVRLSTERPPPRRKDKKKWWNKGPVDSQLRERIDSTASAIACLGSWLEMKIKEDNGSNPQFSFLLSTDANHAFYKDKLAKYLPPRKGLFKAPKPFFQPFFGDEPPDLAPCPFPEGITVKEYDTITLTAQFAVQYRTWFLQELKKRNDPQFDFVESRSGEKFIVFFWLCGLYSRVMMPCHKESMPCMVSTVEAFIQFLQGEKREAAFKSFFDYFADIGMLPPPGHRSVITDDEPINA